MSDYLRPGLLSAADIQRTTALLLAVVLVVIKVILCMHHIIAHSREFLLSVFDHPRMDFNQKCIYISCSNIGGQSIQAGRVRVYDVGAFHSPRASFSSGYFVFVYACVV